jgi:tetratricopeptide (TPR) repeat protein
MRLCPPVLYGLLASASLAALVTVQGTARAELSGDCKAATNPAATERDCSAFLDGKDITTADQVNALTRRGWARQEQNKLDEALSDLNRAVEIDPAYSFAYLWRADLWYRRRDDLKALEDINRAIELRATDPRAFVFRAMIVARRGDLDAALADCNRAIAMNPTLAEAFYRRGEVKRMKGELDPALADYSRAIAINPGPLKFYVGRGDALSAKGEVGRAVADYDKFLAAHPGDKFVQERKRVALAGAPGASNDAGAAAPAQPAAPGNGANAAPEDTAARIERLSREALAAAREKRYDAALQGFDAVLALDPNHQLALRGRAFAYLQKGEFDKAAADLNHAVAQKPDDAAAYAILGDVLQRQRKIDEAIDA